MDRPRPPARTQLDSFLYGYVTNLLYQVQNDDLQELKASIRDAADTVTHNMPQNTWIYV